MALPPDKGDTFVRVDAETAEKAEHEFSDDDEQRRTNLRQPDDPEKDSSAAPMDASELVIGDGDRDDFEIAVDVQDFDRAGQQTKPVDHIQLEELLAACHTPTPPESKAITADNLSAVGQDIGSRTEAQTGPEQPRPETSAWLPAVGSSLGPTTLAVDFGTSYSSVAVVINGRTHVLPLTTGGLRMLPSVVGIDQNGHAVVGEPARQMMLSDPANVVSSPKRLLGRSFDESEVEPHLAQMAMASSKGPQGGILLHAQGRVYTVEQLCAPMLHWLRRAASQQLGRDVTDIVITVPVGFDATQRRALSETATMAGLRIRRFLDEPTAAVLANRQTMDAGGLVAVYDFGGGTFDFSVVDIGENARLSVVTNAGDTWLGGDDFDEALASAAANEFWRETRIELRNDVVRWQRLLRECERAKRELSRKREATIHLAGAALTARGPVDLNKKVTRDEFAELARDLIQRTVDTCETALELCDLKFSDLNAIFMSGGTSYIPAVMEAVARVFGIIPLVVAPPDLAVVLGAASYTKLLGEPTGTHIAVS